ncbi:MAG TPA: PPOX class F420-dependent oxidoreductase [Anaerolineaceae bacterium]|nr:PPOX class F420-dependent oxidoreductase [Anaerolineaceae bacterium]HPN53429.1 PPOX class F420-dependent oxidoreductase [Anaerolineaceae bacterium]
MSGLQAFEKQSYLNLETFRKTGEGLRTPVWFVEDGGTLYVRTVANSGKVKRVRRTSRVNVAPCKVDGKLLGDWQPGEAREQLDAETDRRVNALLNKKYGLMKFLFEIMSKLQRQKYTLLEIKLTRN